MTCMMGSLESPRGSRESWFELGGWNWRFGGTREDGWIGSQGRESPLGIWGVRALLRWNGSRRAWQKCSGEVDREGTSRQPLLIGLRKLSDRFEVTSWASSTLYLVGGVGWCWFWSV